MSNRCEFLMKNGKRCGNNRKDVNNQYIKSPAGRLCSIHVEYEYRRNEKKKLIAKMSAQQSQAEVFSELLARCGKDELLIDAIKLLANMLGLPDPSWLPIRLADETAEYRRKYGEEP